MTDIEQKKIFARNLNKLLELNEKSQREVAEAIDVSPQTFNTWCQAIAIPRMGKVQRLADYFHVPKSYLIDDAPAAESDGDILDKQILDIFKDLPDDKKSAALDYLNYLKDTKK